MKKMLTNYTILAFVAVVIGSGITTKLQASHIMGGDITYNCIGPNTYSIQMQLYEDCNGFVNLGPLESITFSSVACGNISQTIDIPLVAGPDIVTPLCPGEPDACNTSTGAYGIYRYTYKITVTLNQSCPDWTIAWSACCRNAAITTLSGAGSQALYIAAELDNTLGTCNSSPSFLNDPTPFFCAGEAVNYNHGVSEFDGDSLVFSLVPCRQSATTTTNYSGSFSGTNPLATTGGVSINPNTGAISFTPSTAQVAVICVLVEEYRNGSKISEVVRDIQVRVLSCSNSLPQVSGIDGTSSVAGNTGSYDTTICAGENLSFVLNSFDANNLDSVFMNWNFGIQNATFSVDATVQPPVGTFSWNTTPADAGFHIFTVNMTDNACPLIGTNIFTFSVTVLPVPVVDVGGYQVMCGPNDTINLSGNLNALDSIYSWTPTTGLGQPNSLATQAYPSSSTLYKLTKTYTNGCTSADSAYVEFTNGITAPPMNDVSICPGDSVQLNATVSTSTNPPITFTNTTSQPINDFDTTVSPINVTGITPGVVLSTDMIQSVCIDITHGWNDNLDIFLMSPTGTILVLSTDNGGNQDNYTNTCFSPTATIPITSGTSPFTGTFLPEGSFSSLINSNTNGTWQLLVYDDQGFFTGTLNNWSITFNDITDSVAYSWNPTTDLSCANCPTPWASPSTSTTYTVTVSDLFGCTDSSSVNVGIISALNAPTVTCCSVNTTSLTFCWDTIPGAVGYEVSLDNGTTWGPPNSGNYAHQLTGLTLGQSATIEVRAISSCPGTPPSGTQTCTTLPCTLVGQFLTSTDVSCNGGNDGTVTVAATGGTTPYTFSFPGLPNQNNGNFTGIAAGVYDVTITDANGCEDTLVGIIINEPVAITFTTDSTDVSCNGGNNGTATILATGGTGTLTYQWNAAASNQTTSTATGLSAGTYTVTVTDANNCTESTAITVLEPTAIVLDTAKVDVSCNAAADGQAIVITTGGTLPYNFSWSANAGGQTNDTIIGLNGGTYAVTVTDANGCTETISVFVNEEPAITLTTSSTQATCNGIPDGTVTVNAIGGVGGFTYAWGANTGNQTTATATGLNVGTYFVTVTDAAGCTRVTSVAVTTPPAMTLTLSSTGVTTCSYDTDGSATVTPSGGVGGFTYLWSGGTNPTDSTVTGLSVGNYFVTVTDANGCSEIDSVIISGPAPIISNLTFTPVSCNGQSDASASVAPTGGTGGFTYNWSNSATTASITNIPAGQYIVTITDANNCILIDTADIIQPDTLQTTATGTAVSCFGGNDGTATALPIGGQAPFSYAWAGPVSSTDSIATGLTAGNYTLTVTDGGGCTDTVSIIITQPTAPITTVMSTTALSCNGDGSGTATVIASGGTGPYAYLWDANAGGQTTATATGLQAGTYFVTVTDANNCTETDQVTVTEPATLSGTMGATPTSCFGASDGTVTITPTGGVGGYTYNWLPSNATDSSVTNLAAGWHYVTLTDANNCTYLDSVEITQPIGITLALSMTPVVCNGDATGSASVTPSGGVGGFTYSWSSGSTTTTASNLFAGFVSVTVTDANGCFTIDSILVTEPTLITTSTSGTDVNCFNGNDGTATVTASGGTGTYTYAWSTTPTQTNATATNLTAGIYHVTVTDANACTTVDSILINQPPTGVVTSMDSTVLICNGDGTGTATVIATGGSGNYTYLWDTNAGSQTTATATGLQAGTYSVTVTDINSCTVINSVTVTEPTAVMISNIASTATSCFGDTDGTATVNASGGTGTLFYNWQPSGSTGNSISNLAAGWHYVTVTDANSCSISDSVEVLQPAPILTTMSATQVICSGDSSGTATVTPNGGVAPYTYAWSPSGSSSATTTGLAVGWHFVTVTDFNGCSTTDSIEVTEPNPIILTTDTTDVLCFGQATGVATVIPSGGVPGYTYAWNTNPVQTTATATNLPTGNYTVTVTDANGCTATASVFINQPGSPVTVASISSTQISCFGGNDGTATVTVTGGTGAYAYLWTPTGQTTATATNLSIGTYTVLITDANNCFTIDTINVEQPDSIILIATNIQASSCFDGNDGAATVAASGGTPGANNAYTYVWNTIPQQTGATATNLTGGATYLVTAFDALGCSQTLSITIPEPTPIVLSTTRTNVSCNGLSDGMASVSATGGTPGYTYQWGINAGNQTTATISGLSAGTYAVTVTDIFGCSAVTNVIITQPAPLATSSTVEDVTCRGENTGSATTLIAGGTSPYYIVWDANTGNQANSTAENLAAGTYAFTVTDANGCTLVDSITVSEPANELIADIERAFVTCFGGYDGIIQINASGGVPPYKYSLDGVNYDDNSRRIGLQAGAYTVYVQDDNGCIFTIETEMFQSEQFSVDLGPDQSITFGQSYQLDVTTTNGTAPFTYFWTPADNLSCDDCESPSVDSLSNDRYYTVIVTDDNGCEAEDDIFIRVTKPRYVFIANAFTPNDDGVNDVLFVQGGDGTLQVVEFKVFDRWGEMVFEANNTPLNDPAFGWDGTFNDQPMNSGIFAWVAEVEFQDGERIVYKGSVSIIR